MPDRDQPDTVDDVMPVRIDSAEEQYAYLLAHYGGPQHWTVVDQRLRQTDDGRDMERVSLRTSAGELVHVTFVASDDDFLGEQEHLDSDGGTAFLARVMETAFSFSAENPPHHPGTLARFPVPSIQYQRAIAVPMPVLAVDNGRRGLYAPPRVVVINFDSGEPVGVGEFPGFDPERWPPERLGDWPPQATREVDPRQLEGIIARTSACWKRVLDAWFGASEDLDSDLPGDIREILSFRAVLDVPALLPFYDRLNPGFARWLESRR